MNSPITTALFLFAIGLVLLTVGFATRASSGGIVSMWIGIVTVLGAIAYYIRVVV